MNKHHWRLRPQWARNVVCLVVGILLSTICAEAAGISIKRYVIPTYPAMANRARIQGSFVVEINLAAGRVEATRIISHNVYGLGDKKIEGPAPPNFVECIRDSLGRWEFEQADSLEKRTVTLTIEFCLAKTISSGNSAAYTFQVQEKDNLPWKIRIEANRFGPDQSGDTN